MEALRWAMKHHHWREHRNKQERQTKRDSRYGFIPMGERWHICSVNKNTLFSVQPDFHAIRVKGTLSSASLLMLYLCLGRFFLTTFSWALWLSASNLLPALHWILSKSEIVVINSSHMQFSLLATARFMQHVPSAILNASSQ